MRRYSKAAGALLAGLVAVLATGVVTGQAAVWISAAVTGLSAALGAYVAPRNAPRPGPAHPAP